MDKTGLYIAAAFATGVAIGGTVGYLLTKRACDEQQQNELDEVANYYRKKYAKEGDKDESKKADERGEEAEVVKLDKPSITEMSSIVAGYNSDNDNRTSYNRTDIKEQVKEKLKELQKEENKERPKMVALDYSGYMDLDESEDEQEFKYCTDTKQWYDWNNVEYDEEDLPFDPEDVVWVDDQCFLRDEENHATYVLDKVDEIRTE